MDLNVKIIQDTFEQVKPRAEEFASRFLSTLYRHHPKIQPLFAALPLDTQKRMFVAALVQIVSNLENPAFLGEYLGRAGERLAAAGVQESDRDMVRRSLIQTLQQIIGTPWNREYERQWVLVFDLVAAFLSEGLQPALKKVS